MSTKTKALLKAEIDSKVTENGSNQITGEKLNDVLNDMVDSLCDGTNFDEGSIPDAALENPVSVSQNILIIGGEEVGVIDESYKHIPQYIEVKTDSDDKLLSARDRKGTLHEFAGVETTEVGISGNEEYTIEDIEDRLEVETDGEGKVISFRDKNGVKHELVGITAPEITQINKSIEDIEMNIKLTPLNDGDFNVNLTDAQFISLYNSKLTAFCTLNRCHIYCMDYLTEYDSKAKQFETINHNFRADVVFPEMTKEQFMSQLNKYFSLPIYRFADAKTNISSDIDFSLRVGNADGQYNGLGEPSTLVSDDGQKIELFSSSGQYTESSDGINWSALQSFIYHDNAWTNIVGHRSVNKVDGKYMMIAHTYYNSDQYFDLLVSEDKINWYYKGHIFKNGVTDIGNGSVSSDLGNSYLFKDGNGTYYLMYEIISPDFDNWLICLMTCTDILSEQTDDFVGNWVQSSNNPVLQGAYHCCNPEIIKGEDNMPLKHNGYFYCYYLSYKFVGEGTRCATIRRAYSPDMVNWTDEGIIFDNRDTPTGGEDNADNGDQSLCQFKGRSYQFYTHNINNYGPGTTPVPSSIRYLIDDRPLWRLLEIKA